MFDIKPVLVFLIALCASACVPTTLELHIRSARDVRRLNADVVVSLDAYCSAEQTRAQCRETVHPAQAAFADALDAWVDALDRERDADRWEEPRDVVEAQRVGAAYDHLAQVCEASQVETLPALPASYCRHTSAASCPPTEE